MPKNKLLNSIQDNILEQSTSMEEYREQFYDMSLGALKSVADHSNMLVQAIENNPELQKKLTASWLQGKIAIMEDYMLTAFGYIMFNEHDDDDEAKQMQLKEMASLWENIRKKKEKMGKNYKPAKPGDKDRPSKEAWKRAGS